MEENKNTEQVTQETNVTEEAPKRDYETELAQAMAEIKRLKASNDKASSEAADYKKKWKATLDESQQSALAKEEEYKSMKDELESLRKANAVSGLEKSFLELGYPPELATKSAIAQFEGDNKTLFEVQKQVMESIAKNVKAEMTKGMAIPPISNSSVGITKEQFDAMSLAERSELYTKDKALYESLAK